MWVSTIWYNVCKCVGGWVCMCMCLGDWMDIYEGMSEWVEERERGRERERKEKRERRMEGPVRNEFFKCKWIQLFDSKIVFNIFWPFEGHRTKWETLNFWQLSGSWPGFEGQPVSKRFVPSAAILIRFEWHHQKNLKAHLDGKTLFFLFPAHQQQKMKNWALP